MSLVRRAATTLLLVCAMTISTATSSPAAAGDGRLTVDGSGGNGAVRGSIADSHAGSAQIVVYNQKPYWTTIDLQSLGVGLQPGPLLLGGPFAELGIIAPDGHASWQATWDPRQPASVFVRTTPYLGQTDAGPLAAGLTVLSIVVETLVSARKIPATAQRVVARAESLRNAAVLVEQVMGDELTSLLTLEGMTSGKFGEALWDALSDPLQAQVLREALQLFGVTVGPGTLEDLLEWINVLRLSALVIELAWTLGTDSSSGGVLFSSTGQVPEGPQATLTPATPPSGPSGPTPTVVAPVPLSVPSAPTSDPPAPDDDEGCPNGMVGPGPGADGSSGCYVPGYEPGRLPEEPAEPDPEFGGCLAIYVYDPETGTCVDPSR